MKKLKFPSAYTILFGLIILVAGLSWIIPAGQYRMEMNPRLEQEVPVAGTYHTVASNPQGITDIFLAPIDGLWDHKTGKPVPLMLHSLFSSLVAFWESPIKPGRSMPGSSESCYD